MRTRFSVAALASVALSGIASLAAAQQPITIRAGTVLDGKGGVQRNAVVAVEGSRILKVGDGTAETATYDFPRFTVMPGMIDAHVHIGAHFGKDGRASTPGETPADAALMMQLGAEGVFVGSGIFKSEDPLKRAKAIVAATTYFDKPEILAEVSTGLGKAMHGLEIPAIPKEELLAARGW